mgnify:CR=1 FL=1
MSELLALLAPPCVGALIGYVTNKVAIRMLFRPLRPWHLCGWRLPFTPGIIPAKRHALALRIGEMVGARLLTAESISRAIAAETFQQQLQTLMARQIVAFCGRDWPPLSALFLPDHADELVALQKQASKALAGWLQAFLTGPGAEARLLTGTGARLQEASLEPFMQRLLAQALAGSGESLGRFCQALLRQAAAQGLGLIDLVPEDLSRRLAAFMQAQGPLMLERVADEVLAQERRPQVVELLVALVYQVLGSLGALGAIAQGFFESGAMAGKIDRYLDSHGDEVRGWLTSPPLQRQLATVLKESVDVLLRRPLADLLNELPPGELDALCRNLGERLVAALSDPAANAHLAGQLALGLARLLRAAPDGKTSLLASVAAFFREEAGQALLRDMAAALVRQLFGGAPGPILGPLFRQFPDSTRELVKTRLVRLGKELLLRELPGLVQALNFRELISEKIDALDLLQLEQLLLGIMAEQFRYINLFGAVLGFLIGGLNLALQGLR